eukprot:jgi/Mesen1/9258/ME000006S09258
MRELDVRRRLGGPREGGRKGEGEGEGDREGEEMEGEGLGGDNKPVLYDLYSKDGRRLCNRKILMEVHAARAEPQMRITSFITTWNVGQSPPPNDLSPWLPTDSQHELVVVGSQECEYSPPAPYATCGQHWVASLRAHFGELYKVVRATSRGQMRLVVLVREDVEFWDTSLCFVNSHLAAHDGQCDARNSNYRGVKEGTTTGFLWLLMLLLMPVLVLVLLLGLEPSTCACVKKGTETEYLDKRFPAWCDRILWRSLPGCAASLKSYQSCPQVLTSDHKPVRAVLELMTFALPIEHFSEAHRGRDKDSHKRWHIRFLSLRGCNLKAADANGLSDPYVIFCGPNLLRPAKTSVKTKTLNPVWEPSEVPRLVLGLKSLMRVEKDYILFSVFDKDFASADDHLGYGVILSAEAVLNLYFGYGVIPLAEAVDAHFRGPSETARFKTLLMLAGIPVGTLEGEIRLSWEPDEDSDRSATWHPLEALQQQAAQLRLLVKNWRTSSKSDYVGLQLQHAHRQPSTGGGV